MGRGSGQAGHPETQEEMRWSAPRKGVSHRPWRLCWKQNQAQESWEGPWPGWLGWWGTQHCPGFCVPASCRDANPGEPEDVCGGVPRGGWKLGDRAQKWAHGGAVAAYLPAHCLQGQGCCGAGPALRTTIASQLASPPSPLSALLPCLGPLTHTHIPLLLSSSSRTWVLVVRNHKQTRLYLKNQPLAPRPVPKPPPELL